jgi:lysophospholipid acyltransferase (LPLAT)-like uncharacterized protein
VAKPGVALLARRADALILPMAFHSTRVIIFNSWDRTRLPLPFSRMDVLFAPPIDPRQWMGDDEAHAEQLGRLLDALEQRIKSEIRSTKSETNSKLRK